MFKGKNKIYERSGPIWLYKTGWSNTANMIASSILESPVFFQLSSAISTDKTMDVLRKRLCPIHFEEIHSLGVCAKKPLWTHTSAFLDLLKHEHKSSSPLVESMHVEDLSIFVNRIQDFTYATERFLGTHIHAHFFVI